MAIDENSFRSKIQLMSVYFCIFAMINIMRCISAKKNQQCVFNVLLFDSTSVVMCFLN